MKGTLLFRVAGVGHILTGIGLSAVAIFMYRRGIFTLGAGYALGALFNFGFGYWMLRRQWPENP